MGKTLLDKIWDEHTICILPDGKTLLHVDRHILHDFTAPQAFAALEAKGRSVRNPELTAATEDHVVATTPGRDETTLKMGSVFLEALRKATGREGIRNFDLTDAQQGIVHVVAPELGIALPGATLACGDSHTCTVGGIGSLSIGIGTSDVEHIMATQTLKFIKPKRMRITVSGELGAGVTAKDLILHIIGKVGAAGGVGHAVEYAGEVVRALPVEARLTLCNMSIELGARTGMVAPDKKTIEYISGRPFAPQGDELDAAIVHWRTLFSDEDAVFDKEVTIDGSEIAPAYGDVAVPIAEAMARFVDGAYGDAVNLLLPVRANLSRMGGSVAQRDLIEWTLTAAAVRAGERGVALSLANERLAFKPDSFVNQRFRTEAEAISA